MTSLSPVDTAFFLLETEQRPMNVGVLVVLAPPRGTRGRFADRLVATMLKVPVGPPFNYRLHKAPVTGLLSLEPDAKIDASRQVFRHKLPVGCKLQGLFEQVSNVHAELLDRSAPLWQVHVFEGLPAGRVAMYFKTHHGLIDGLGFIKIVTGTVSTTARARKPQSLWRGMPGGAPGGAVTSGASSRVYALANLALETRRTAYDLARLAWHQRLRDLGIGRGLMTPFVTTPDVLKTAPTPHRVLAHCRLPLAQVRSLARANDAKINDVLLTVLDISMTRYLAERGTPPRQPLVADIPVALEDHGGTGNRITILQVPMGRPGGTPAERLQDVVRETREMKRELRAISGNALMLYSIIEHSVASLIESLNLRPLPMLANAVVSNPAGLTERVYFNGASVELALPVSVVGHHQVLNITVTTYVDQLDVTFIALREAMPDLPRLADFTVTALDDLARDLAPHRRRRPAARASIVRGSPGRAGLR
jgi:diacylglycerol O-acyltransferase